MNVVNKAMERPHLAPCFQFSSVVIGGSSRDVEKGCCLQVGRRAYLLHGEQGCWPAEPKEGEGDLLLSKTVPGKME